MTKLKRIAGCLLSLALAACGNGNGQTEEICPAVTVDTVISSNEHANLQFPGRVKAAQDVSLSFKVSGTLQRFFVDEGDAVRKGQLLAEMDATDYRVQLEATEAEYKQVKADAERVMALYKENSATASDNDKARYGLQQMEAKLAYHRNRVAYTRIYAPFDGHVQQRLFDGGETVDAGMPVLTLLGNGSPEVEIHLPASAYLQRQRFDSYSCTLDVLPGQTLSLRPIALLPKANANQLYTMRLQIADSRAGGQPSPGMSAWVTIGLTADSTALLMRVPRGALLEEGGQTYVFRYDSRQGTVHRIAVQPKRMLSDGNVWVAGDLPDGSLVVSCGTHQVKDGRRVKLLPRPSATNIGGML